MKISSVRAILTAPAGIALVVVRVDTDVEGLFGLGCATFTQRPTLVAQTVDEYLAPLLNGRDPANITDLWQMMSVNAYWRNGPVMNNAISGVDMALWDIKGKIANMPVYDLIGGRCREAARIYGHADGREPAEVLDNARQLAADGYTAVRCQVGLYGGARAGTQPELRADFPGTYYDPAAYMRAATGLFEHVRPELGEELDLLHDVHERLAPADAIRLARDLEPYRLYFLEDPLPPEQPEWFRQLRAQTVTPLAMGELHNHPLEWRQLISERLIDFVRTHISQIGGITPARRLADFAAIHGVRTAWHGPGDVSPVGHAANLHLDLASPNFGIQEVAALPAVLYDVFPGTPEIHDGHLWPNETPGLGIDLDETLAARYPVTPEVVAWTEARLPDGTLWTP